MLDGSGSSFHLLLLWGCGSTEINLLGEWMTLNGSLVWSRGESEVQQMFFTFFLILDRSKVRRSTKRGFPHAVSLVFESKQKTRH